MLNPEFRLITALVRLACGGVTLLLVMLMTSSQTVFADDLTVGSELKAAGTRLLDESTDFAVTPFTLKDGNLFWTIGIAGAVGFAYAYDGEIRSKLQGNIRSHGMDKATDAGELIGNPYLHLGVAALVYGGGIAADSPKWKETGEMMAEALVLADGATLLIKEAAGRGRPSVSVRKGDYKPFSFTNDYDSFPSMHTASSFAMASVIARTSESIPVAVLSYTAAAFVGFSRIYQNKHWASDVLLGAAIGELAGRVVTHYHTDRNRRLAVLPAFNGEAVTMNLLYRF